MSANLVSDVKELLVANGQGASLWMGRLPDSPAAAVALLPQAGRAPEFVHDKPGIAIDRPSLQVLVRDPIFDTAYARACAIRELLSRFVNGDLGGTTYLRFEPLGGVVLLERDAKDWTVVTATYYASLTP